MSSYRIFAGATAGVSALILLLTQVVGGPDQSAVPDIEPLPTVAPSPTPSPSAPEPSPPRPSLTPDQPHPEIGTVIYEHDFSSPEGGLLGGQSSDSGTNEFGSRYAEYTGLGRLFVRSESELATYVSGASTLGVFAGGRELIDLRDVSVEVDMTPTDIGPGAARGLACRRDREVGSFYFAFVSGVGDDAGAGIIRQDEPGGDWIEVASESTLPDGVVVGVGETNRLRLDCIGNDIRLYVDDRLAVEGSDSTFSSGALALFVNPLGTSGETAAAEAEFDNLVIREA